MAHTDTGGVFPIARSSDRLALLGEAGQPQEFHGRHPDGLGADPTLDPEVAKLLKKQSKTKTGDVPFESQMIARRDFQIWLNKMRESGLATSKGERIVGISEQGTRQFALGIAGDRVFIGIGGPEAAWFKGLPWLHVAIKKDTPFLNFVSEETMLNGTLFQSFAVCFAADDAQKTNHLAKCHFLDVRQVVMGPNGVVTAVHSQVLSTIDVVIVEDDKSILSLLDGKQSNGFTNRSRFKSAMK
jgi:hypothetical protein